MVTGVESVEAKINPTVTFDAHLCRATPEYPFSQFFGNTPRETRTRDHPLNRVEVWRLPLMPAWLA